MNTDKLNFSQVYFLVGVLKGRSMYTNDKELQRIAYKLEDELDKALGYKEDKK